MGERIKKFNTYLLGLTVISLVALLIEVLIARWSYGNIGALLIKPIWFYGVGIGIVVLSIFFYLAIKERRKNVKGALMGIASWSLFFELVFILGMRVLGVILLLVLPSVGTNTLSYSFTFGTVPLMFTSPLVAISLILFLISYLKSK